MDAIIVLKPLKMKIEGFESTEKGETWNCLHNDF